MIATACQKKSEPPARPRDFTKKITRIRNWRGKYERTKHIWYPTPPHDSVYGGDIIDTFGFMALNDSVICKYKYYVDSHFFHLEPDADSENRIVFSRYGTGSTSHFLSEDVYYYYRQDSITYRYSSGDPGGSYIEFWHKE
jgi:hypothetical protein